MFRYKTTMSYQGTHFSGSQRQRNGCVTVFNVVESVFSRVLNHRICCVPSGRTDTGVHAKEMVFHFDIPFTFSIDVVQRSINRHLLDYEMRIRDIELIDLSFHALSSAVLRTYEYFFTFESNIPQYLISSVYYIDQRPLFIPTEKEVSEVFLRIRNFDSLCSRSETKTTIRTIQDIRLSSFKYRDLHQDCVEIYCLRVSSIGFLYRMVRHIVGILLHSMLNFTNMDYLKDYLYIHRGLSYKIAPARGLHLVEIEYNSL